MFLDRRAYQLDRAGYPIKKTYSRQVGSLELMKEKTCKFLMNKYNENKKNLKDCVERKCVKNCPFH